MPAWYEPVPTPFVTVVGGERRASTLTVSFATGPAQYAYHTDHSTTIDELLLRGYFESRLLYMEIESPVNSDTTTQYDTMTIIMTTQIYVQYHPQ